MSAITISPATSALQLEPWQTCRWMSMWTPSQPARSGRSTSTKKQRWRRRTMMKPKSSSWPLKGSKLWGRRLHSWKPGKGKHGMLGSILSCWAQGQTAVSQSVPSACARCTCAASQGCCCKGSPVRLVCSRPGETAPSTQAHTIVVSPIHEDRQRCNVLHLAVVLVYHRSTQSNLLHADAVATTL